jgi:hypothetical protein
MIQNIDMVLQRKKILKKSKKEVFTVMKLSQMNGYIQIN